MGSVSLSLHFFLEDCFEGEWTELVACALVELVLELDPMKSQSMQEALQGIHAHKHEEGEGEESQVQEEIL